MTKEDWMHIRKKEEIPLSLFHEYYLEVRDKNRVLITLGEFESYFPQFMGHGIILTNTGVKTLSFENIVHKVYNYFDNKFE